jgi:hypothetical protein
MANNSEEGQGSQRAVVPLMMMMMMMMMNRSVVCIYIYVCISLVNLWSRVRIQMTSLTFFNLPNLSSHTTDLGWSQSLREMSTRNFSEGKARPAHNSDLTAVC